MLSVMSQPSPHLPPALHPTASPSAHKRPRGIWKGRRGSPDPKTPSLSHDLDTDFEDDHRLDSYDDDLDDSRSTSSTSSSKRRRVSGAYSDSGNPASRPLSPDPSHSAFSGLYHAHRSHWTTTMPMIKPRSVSFFSTSTSSSGSDGKGKKPTIVDVEDWENLKELFSRAAELCEHDEFVEALPLLRAVLRECHRMLTLYPDPSIIYMDAQNVRGTRSPAEAVTPTDERLHRDWGQDVLDQAVRSNPLRTRPVRHGELPTAFHATFGIALFLMGSIIAQDPSLALPDEPSSPSTYWLGALDVFETGENLPVLLEGKGMSEISEDWRMAIAWGRTLVCLADEKISSSIRAEAEKKAQAATSNRPPTLQEAWAAVSSNSGSPFPLTEPVWPKDSPFYSIALNRPPVTRRMSLYSASAHDIMVLATDQFSRGVFHMPHPHYSSSHNPTHLHTTSMPPPIYRHPSDSPMASPTSFDITPTPSTASSTGSGSTITSYFHPIPSSSHYHSPSTHQTSRSHFSRPKELFTIASEVLGVSERLQSAANREYWAVWADSVFNQMKMEADIDVWRGAVTRARGRCWLVVGSARSEELEEAMERGDMSVLKTQNAEEAREALTMAISFFERAKGSATTTPDEDTEDVSPLLTEALITLANLTPDENKREELYSRAQAEGGDEIIMELGLPTSSSAPAPSAPSGSEAMDTGDNASKERDDDAMDES